MRVVPDVLGLDKEFDYSVPDGDDTVDVGDLVRIDLHGRRVRAWVVAVDPPDAHTVGLKPIRSWSSVGPTRDLVELASWAATRWAGRRRTFLAAASPQRVVQRMPARPRGRVVAEPRSPASTRILASGGGVLRLPPASDPLPAVSSAVAFGPTLVIVPNVDRAMIFAARLRRSGLSVALVPGDWTAAAVGADVVIGTRTAAWAPCAGLAAAVVIDEHDESLQEEGSPTWHARDVVIERCRRLGAPVLLISPCPTLTAIEWGPVTRPPVERERRGWAEVEVVDRGDEPPWARSLVTSPLVEALRDHERTVVCVTNTTGRARLLACRTCRELGRCEQCDAAVVQDDGGSLQCNRCDTRRPLVCLACGAGRFAVLRPGVTRLREELEAAAGRPVDAVTGGVDAPLTGHRVVVGTEAVLHRIDRADVVAFLEFDRELLAPRYRAAEQALALVVRAARLVGDRTGGGRILLQTFLPEHEVVRAASAGDPDIVVDVDRRRRDELGFPPFGALAEVAGRGSEAFVRSLPVESGVVVAGDDDRYVIKAASWERLGAVLAAGVRPSGSRLRIAVDPPRL
ncbi:MAG: hypothetical protein ACO225_10300 [Ilumatobacteraceae bacterium]